MVHMDVSLVHYISQSEDGFSEEIGHICQSYVEVLRSAGRFRRKTIRRRSGCGFEVVERGSCGLMQVPG